MKKVFLFLLLISLLAGCSSKLDFDQTKDFKTIQQWDGSIFRSQLTGEDLYPNGMAVSILTDTIPFQFFDNREVRNAFVKVELETYCRNQLPSSFRMVLTYLDHSDVIHSTAINIAPGTPQNPYEFTLTETIDTTAQPDFRRVNQIAVDIIRNDAVDISQMTDTLTIGLNGSLFTQIKN